ncbi:MAG: nucleoside-diphosphate sugar epimerase [Verrucomicrobia bacterium]|nr:MAG: nucleoside-diphosphate sugar epimerase [Verrucomicrobiota bacterium]
MDNPEHILVTGGAGFIGSHLVERLLHEGESVTLIDDCSTGSLDNLRAVISNPNIRVIQGKVSECNELPEVVSDSNSIYHLAAAVGVELVVNSPIRTIQTNLRETEAVLEAAGRHGVPVLLASTSEVYGKSQKSAFSEEDDPVIGPPNLGRWSYACSKLMDEFLAMAYARERGLPVIIARLFNTVGPRQTGRYGMVLPRFIAAAKSGRPLKVYGDGSQARCFCYVADTVEALVRLQNCPGARGEVFNVGSTEEISIRELAELVVRTLNSSSRIEHVPYHKAYAPGFEDMLRRKPVIEKLRSKIDFCPNTPLRKVIELTAAAA